jgi:pSer/pThr/pTyr-binding forkhead associated (FHA) protein
VHCSIRRSGGRVIVEDHSSQGTFLNDQRVAGARSVAAGDRLRVGVPGVELQFITVADDDAAPRD